MIVIRFEQPAELMNMNHRLHWSKQRRQARAWRGVTCLAARQQLASFPMPLWPATVTVVVPVHDRRRRDPANLAPVAKHCVDGLVDAGVWPDDTPDWVTVTEPRLRSAAHNDWSVLVEITPRSPQ